MQYYAAMHNWLSDPRWQARSLDDDQLTRAAESSQTLARVHELLDALALELWPMNPWLDLVDADRASTDSPACSCGVLQLTDAASGVRTAWLHRADYGNH